MLRRTRERRPMNRWVVQWGSHLRIQHKVWVVLLLLCVPLSAGIAIHLYIVHQLLELQQQRQELMLADAQVHALGRLAIDIEDGFRGYVLTQQPAFLAPLLKQNRNSTGRCRMRQRRLRKLSGSPNSLATIEQQLKDLLRSKHELISDIQKGPADKALAYVRSGEGLRLFRSSPRRRPGRRRSPRTAAKFIERTSGCVVAADVCRTVDHAGRCDRAGMDCLTRTGPLSHGSDHAAAIRHCKDWSASRCGRDHRAVGQRPRSEGRTRSVGRGIPCDGPPHRDEHPRDRSAPHHRPRDQDHRLGRSGRGAPAYYGQGSGIGANGCLSGAPSR